MITLWASLYCICCIGTSWCLWHAKASDKFGSLALLTKTMSDTGNLLIVLQYQGNFNHVKIIVLPETLPVVWLSRLA